VESLSGVRILLVDDHEDTLEFMTVLLESAGAEVRTAPTAADALVALAGFQPDVLLTDLGLPDGDGGDLVRSMRARDGLAEVPAIALTGDSRVPDACFQRRLLKPVEPAALFRALSILTKNSSEGGIMAEKNVETGLAYYKAFSDKDPDGIAQHLDAAVELRSPMAENDGRDAVVEAAKRLMGLIVSLEVRATFSEGERVVIIYDLQCSAPVGLVRTAAFMTFREGLISRIELFFDGRPFERNVGGSQPNRQRR